MSAVIQHPSAYAYDPRPAEPAKPEMPSNIEAEEALLGAIMLNNDAYSVAASIVKPHHFSVEFLGSLFEIMGKMVAKGEVVGPITLKPYVNWSERVGEITVGQYIARLVSSATGAFATASFARAIVAAWQRCEMVRAAQEMMTKALEAAPDIEPETIAAEAGDRILDIVNAGVEKKASRQYGDILLRAMQRSQERRNDDTALIRWFLPEVNEVVGPVRPGNLVGLMSDSGGGKTSFSSSQCRFAAENGAPTAFFSIEITDEEAALQMAAQRIGVSMGEIDEGDLLKAKENALFAEAEIGSRLPFVIESFDSANMKEITARIGMLKKRMGLRFVMIDHAKMIDLPGAKGDMFAEKVNGLYRGLKAIAKQTGVAIVILIQRNGDWRGRENPTPVPSDAYGGGGVIQNLDAMFSIYRPEPLYQNKLEMETNDKRRDRFIRVIEDTRGYAWIINHKRRRGAPLGKKRIRFEASLTLFQSDRAAADVPSELPF